ncbi:MAG: hypothetical protein RIC29_04665 [Rhodospirillaceae bacterium]
MTIEPTLQSVVTSQRSNLLNQIGNAAQGSQAANTRATVASVTEQVQKKPINDDPNFGLAPPPAGRGSKLDISI